MVFSHAASLGVTFAGHQHHPVEGCSWRLLVAVRCPCLVLWALTRRLTVEECFCVTEVLGGSKSIELERMSYLTSCLPSVQAGNKSIGDGWSVKGLKKGTEGRSKESKVIIDY